MASAQDGLLINPNGLQENNSTTTDDESMTAFTAIVNEQRNFFNTNKTVPIEHRKDGLRRLRALITENEDALCEAVYKDLRRAPGLTRAVEISNCVLEIDYFLAHIDEWAKPTYVERTLTSALDTPMIVKEPKGVVLLLSPWNYPLNMIFLPIVPIIAAGNTCIIKPSEVSSNVAETMGLLVSKYFDKRFVTVVQGGPEETTELLKERFDHIMYTGSTTIAKVIMKAASEFVTPLTLELGGKCPVIVADDADIALTARRVAWGKLLNCGQTCLAPDYIITTPKTKALLVPQLKKYIEEFYTSNAQKSPDYSRIINERHFDRIHSLLEQTQCPVLYQAGEVDRADLFIPPTVLEAHVADVSMKGEIFGPILPIVTVDEIEDAVHIVQAGEKPLAAYVFTKSSALADHIIRDTSSGGVTVNDVIMHITVDTLPFGGIGHSGMGRYRGKFGFETFSHEKAVLKRSFFGEALIACRYPPLTPSKEKQMQQLTGSRIAVPRVVRNYLPSLSYLLVGVLIGFLIQRLR